MIRQYQKMNLFWILRKKVSNANNIIFGQDETIKQQYGVYYLFLLTLLYR